MRLLKRKNSRSRKGLLEFFITFARPYTRADLPAGLELTGFNAWAEVTIFACEVFMARDIAQVRDVCQAQSSSNDALIFA